MSFELRRGELRKDLMQYITAGNSTFTIQNDVTNNHITYKCKKLKDKKKKNLTDPDIWFLYVLAGTDNYAHYAFLGTIRDENSKWTYSHSRKSKIMANARPVISFEWFMDNCKKLPPEIHFYHEGGCGRCGRKLTHPESIETGYGPECFGKMSEKDKDIIISKLLEQYIFNTEGTSED